MIAKFLTRYIVDFIIVFISWTAVLAVLLFVAFLITRGGRV